MNRISELLNKLEKFEKNVDKEEVGKVGKKRQELLNSLVDEFLKLSGFFEKNQVNVKGIEQYNNFEKALERFIDFSNSHFNN